MRTFGKVQSFVLLNTLLGFVKMHFTFLPGSLASYRTLIAVFNSQIIQSHVVPRQELYQDLFFKTARPGYDADKIRKESLQCKTNLFGWELRLPCFTLPRVFLVFVLFYTKLCKITVKKGGC
jgi:hypothetical protein